MATGLFTREDAADADELAFPTLDVTVESQGSRNKHEHDAQRDRIVLDHTLFSSVPADDGFVEDTSPRRRPLEEQPREVPAESPFTKA
jgi:hypothetical protein